MPMIDPGDWYRPRSRWTTRRSAPTPRGLKRGFGTSRATRVGRRPAPEGREIQLAEAGLARIRLVGGGRAFDVQEVLHPANSRDATHVALEDLDLLGLLDLAAEHDHAASHVEVDVALGDLRIPEDLALHPLLEGNLIDRRSTPDVGEALARPITLAGEAARQLRQLALTAP